MVASYEVWSVLGCSACQEVEERLERIGVPFEKKDLGTVVRNEVPDSEVMAQLIMQDNMAPVVVAVKDDGSRQSIPHSALPQEQEAVCAA